MGTLTILYHTFLPNMLPILEILSFFLLTSIVGLAIIRFFIHEKSWWILIPGSGIAGVFGLIFFLACFSYFLKGSGGILAILVIYVLFGVFLWLKFPFNLPKILLGKIDLFWGVVCCGFLGLFFLIAGVNIYGGDVIAYWGFATSFANGNYPVMSPWQPDLLAAHHQGAFLYQGAVYSLIRVNMQLIHSLFAFFIVSTGFFFLWGSSRKLLRSTGGALLVAMMFYFAFSAIFIVLPKDFISFFSPEVTHEINTLPRFIDAKNRLGGSSNLNEIYYLNHRAASFAGLFFVLYLFLAQFRLSEKWRLPVIGLFTVVIMSTDEVTLPAIAMAGAYYLITKIKSSYTRARWELIKYGLVAAGLFIVLFFIVGSALRDSFLIHSDVPRFQLNLSATSLVGRFKEIKSAILTFPNLPVLVLLPDLFITTFFSVTLAFKRDNYWNQLVLAASLGTLIAFFTVEHTFYPGNQGRFLHLLYLLITTSFTFGLVKFFLDSSKRIRYFLAGLMILLFGLGLSSSTLYLLKETKASNYPNYNYKQPEEHRVFYWLGENVSNKRIFFLDGYLKGVSYSHYSLFGIQNFGLMIPVAPAFIKVHTPDFGIEAFDVIDSLDPESVGDLKIDYIYLVKGQEKTFDFLRQQELRNPNYFPIVYQDQEGTLYKITDIFKENGWRKKGRLRDLKQLIPKRTSIFLQAPPELPISVRSVALLALQMTGTVYTDHSSGFFNYIETKLTYEKPVPNQRYDFVFVSPETDPLTVCNCRKVDDFFNTAGLKGYKVVR